MNPPYSKVSIKNNPKTAQQQIYSTHPILNSPYLLELQQNNQLLRAHNEACLQRVKQKWKENGALKLRLEQLKTQLKQKQQNTPIDQEQNTQKVIHKHSNSSLNNITELQKQFDHLLEKSYTLSGTERKTVRIELSALAQRIRELTTTQNFIFDI